MSAVRRTRTGAGVSTTRSTPGAPATTSRPTPIASIPAPTSAAGAGVPAVAAAGIPTSVTASIAAAGATAGAGVGAPAPATRTAGGTPGAAPGTARGAAGVAGPRAAAFAVASAAVRHGPGRPGSDLGLHVGKLRLAEHPLSRLAGNGIAVDRAQRHGQLVQVLLQNNGPLRGLDLVVIGRAAVGGHGPGAVPPQHLRLDLGLQSGKPLRFQYCHRSFTSPYVAETGTCTHADPL